MFTAAVARGLSCADRASRVNLKNMIYSQGFALTDQEVPEFSTYFDPNPAAPRPTGGPPSIAPPIEKPLAIPPKARPAAWAQRKFADRNTHAIATWAQKPVAARLKAARGRVERKLQRLARTGSQGSAIRKACEIFQTIQPGDTRPRKRHPGPWTAQSIDFRNLDKMLDHATMVCFGEAPPGPPLAPPGREAGPRPSILKTAPPTERHYDMPPDPNPRDMEYRQRKGFGPAPASWSRFLPPPQPAPVPAAV